MPTPSDYPGTVFHVWIWIDPKNASEFEGHLRKCYEKVILEPECTFFEVMNSPERPGEYCFVEGWTCDKKEWEEVWIYYCSGTLLSPNIDAFRLQVQGTKPYRAPYEKATRPMWLKPRQSYAS